MRENVKIWVRVVLAAAAGFLVLGFPRMTLTQSVDGGAGTSFLQRPVPSRPQIRVMSWNVKADSIFGPSGVRRESFGRVLRAIKPDVLCLQEIFPLVETSELVNQLESDFPPPGGGGWFVHRASDNVIASRFPFVRTGEDLPVPFPRPGMPDFRYGQATALVDIPDNSSSVDFYVIAVHNKSGSNESSRRLRQRQSDSVVRWIRGLKDTDDPRHLPHGTPLVILGDLNVLESEPRDASLHLTTLLTGNILEEATYGPDIHPDWDRSNLIEVKPRHNGRDKDYYTWRLDSSPFPPGALDRVIYTDSVLSVLNSFVLDTTTLREDELKRYGLLADDVLLDGNPGEYDHLPLAVDFALPGAAPSELARP